MSTIIIRVTLLTLLNRGELETRRRRARLGHSWESTGGISSRRALNDSDRGVNRCR